MSISTATESVRRLSKVQRYLLFVVSGFLLVSAVRVLSGANDITSSGALRAALVAAMPIALAGLGGLWSERAGVVNIGLEGMMALGTLGAGYFGYHYGVWAGVTGAMLFGAVGGLVHALATVIFGVDHIVSGVAINIIAPGVTGFLAVILFSNLPGAGPTQSPLLPIPYSVNLGFLADPARVIEDKHWFVVSDLAGLVGAFTRNFSSLTILAMLLFVLTWWLLWRTPFGLRLRSCGESPVAAESLGVNVYLYKSIAVTVSGTLAGLAGAYLSMVASSGFQQGQTRGLGYIGLAAMIFGNWRPTGLFLGAVLFGYTDAVQLRQGTSSLHALLLVVAALMLAIAVAQLRKGARAPAAVSVGAAFLFTAWYFATHEVAREFTTMAPYVTTLLVLAFASQQLRMPAADGRPYRKGSGEA